MNTYDVVDKLKDKGFEIRSEIFSDKNDNHRKKIMVACSLCKKEITSSVIFLLNKKTSLCRECSNKTTVAKSKKISYEDVQKTIDASGCELLTKKHDYKDSHDYDLKIKCKTCGEIFNRSFTVFKRAKTQCRNCSMKKHHGKSRNFGELSDKKLSKLINNIGLKFIKRSGDNGAIIILCKKCGKEYYTSINKHFTRSRNFERNIQQCIQCSRGENKSHTEKEISDFLNLNSIRHESSNRKILNGKELDIYIPDNNIAIEVDGVYWHSEEVSDDSLNLFNKTKLCEEKNIRCIHVFDIEWNEKKDIIKSIILAKLGKIKNTIAARKCTIKLLQQYELKQFLDLNHIQGNDNASIRIGMFNAEELVAVMSFKKARFNKNYEWEMSRFCSKLNTVVVGSFGRMMSYFEKNFKPQSLVTYADRRYSQGEIYSKNGFKLIRISKPNYWYLYKGRLVNRMKFQKHKLQTLLKEFDQNLSEVENMKKNGYTRIFDCANYVFAKIY